MEEWGRWSRGREKTAGGCTLAAWMDTSLPGEDRTHGPPVGWAAMDGNGWGPRVGNGVGTAWGGGGSCVNPPPWPVGAGLDLEGVLLDLLGEAGDVAGRDAPTGPPPLLILKGKDSSWLPGKHLEEEEG